MVNLNLLENFMTSFTADRLHLSRVKTLLRLISTALRRRSLMSLVRGQVEPLLFLHLLSCHDICALRELFSNLRHYPFALNTAGFLKLLRISVTGKCQSVKKFCHHVLAFMFLQTFKTFIHISSTN